MGGGMGDDVVNKNFQFRLDKRDPNEAEVWSLIEEAAQRGVGLRELVVESILLRANKPLKSESNGDKLLRQLRYEIQRFADLLDQSNFGMGGGGYAAGEMQTEDDAGRSKLSKKIMRNIAGLISEATEFEDE